MPHMDVYTNPGKSTCEECERLRAENKTLRERLGLPHLDIRVSQQTVVEVTQSSNPNFLTIDQKIALFRSYFRGRDDVYALRWEGKEGKKGYAPASTHDWNCPLCSHDRKNKRSRCENRKFLSLANEAIHSHLSGKSTIGLYPLLADEAFLTNPLPDSLSF